MRKTVHFQHELKHEAKVEIQHNDYCKNHLNISIYRPGNSIFLAVIPWLEWCQEFDWCDEIGSIHRMTESLSKFISHEDADEIATKAYKLADKEWHESSVLYGKGK